MKNTDDTRELRTTDDIAVSVADEVDVTDVPVVDNSIGTEVVEEDGFPKSWTDGDKRQYDIVVNYFKAMGLAQVDELQFEGIEHKVLIRARRDVKEND